MKEMPNAREILARTGETIGRNPAHLILPLIFFAGVTTAIDFAETTLRPLNNLVSVLLAVAQYQVTQLVLRNEDLHDAPGGAGRVASFVGAGILTGVLIGLASLLFILPGLFLYARWSMINPLIIGTGANMGDAMQRSWDGTRDNVVQVMIAFGVILLPLALGLWILFTAFDSYGVLIQPPALLFIGNALIYLGFMLSCFGAIAMYSFGGAREDLRDIFA